MMNRIMIADSRKPVCSGCTSQEPRGKSQITSTKNPWMRLAANPAFCIVFLIVGAVPFVHASTGGEDGAPVSEAEKCGSEFHEVAVGASACGISFTDDRLVRLDGEEISKVMQQWREEPAESQKLVLFPRSPTGRFIVVAACSSVCEMLLIDREDRTAKGFSAGLYGPNEWLSWSADEALLVLASFDEGASVLHVVETRNAYVYDTAWGNYSLDTFTWLAPRRFKIEVGKCDGYMCGDASVPSNLTRIEFEASDCGVDVVAIDDPSGAPVAAHNAFLEHRIVAGETRSAEDAAVTESGPDAAGVLEEHRVELADGTVLVGEIKAATLPFESSFGPMQIDPKEAESFAGDSLRLRDGSMLKGQFGEGKAEIATARGTFDIQIQHVAAIGRGEASGTGSAGATVKPGAGQGVLTGRVVDNFGKPVAGALVQIVGSSLSAETNGDGRYEVPYIPGRIFVRVERAGYDPVSFSVQLAEAAVFPVEEKIMVKAPLSAEVYLRDESDWTALGHCWVRQTVQDTNQFDASGEDRYVVQGEPLLIVAEGAPAFLDATGITPDGRGQGLSLYPVADDGTIISVQRDAGWGGFMSQINGSNEVTKEIALTRREIGAGRPLYEAPLSPGVYAFVSRNAITQSSGESDRFCYMLELKTRERIARAKQYRQQLACETIAAFDAWNASLVSASASWSPEDWQRLETGARKLQELRQQRLAPDTVDPAPLASTARVAAEFAKEALEERRWEDALLWADRAMRLDPHNRDATEASDEATYQHQSRLAKEAFAKEKWTEAGSAAVKALAIQPGDEEMVVIAKRHEFESTWQEAKRLDEKGALRQAREKMLEAIKLRDESPNFSLSRSQARDQDLYFTSILERLSSEAATAILNNSAPRSEDVDDAIDLILESIDSGSTSKRLRNLYNQLSEVVHTPGLYLGKYMQLTRRFQAFPLEKIRHSINFKAILTFTDSNTFLTVISADDVARLWKVNQPAYTETMPYYMKNIRKSFSDQFSFYYKGATYSTSPDGAVFGLDDKLSSIVFGPNNALLACSRSSDFVGFKYGVVKVVDNAEKYVGISAGEQCKLAVAPAGHLLAVAGKRDDTGTSIDVYHLRLVSGEVEYEQGPSFPIQNSFFYGGELLFSADGKRIAVFDYKSAEVFDISASRKVSSVRHDSSADSWAFSPTLKSLLRFGGNAQDESPRLRLLSIDGHNELASMELQRKQESPKRIALFPTRNIIILGFKDASLEIYSPNLPQLPADIEDSSGPIASIEEREGSSQIMTDNSEVGKGSNKAADNDVAGNIPVAEDSYEFLGNSPSVSGEVWTTSAFSSSSARKADADISNGDGASGGGDATSSPQSVDILGQNDRQSCGSAEECLGAGENAMKERALEQSRELFQRAARAGSAEAHLRVGRMYDPDTWSEETSPEAQPNWETAAYWYERGARTGSVEAQVNAGRVLCLHAKDSLNREQGRKLLERAVAEGAGEEAAQLLDECRELGK